MDSIPTEAENKTNNPSTKVFLSLSTTIIAMDMNHGEKKENHKGIMFCIQVMLSLKVHCW